MKLADNVTSSPERRSWEKAGYFAEESIPNSQSSNLVQQLCVWFQGVRAYHQADIGGAPTEQDRQMQKQILSSLISMGEWLVAELKKRDVASHAGVTISDVEAALEALYDSQRASFGGMTKERREQVLNEVFGGA